MPKLIKDTLIGADFIENGSKLLNYVANYQNNIRDLSVKPSHDLKPGYLRNLLPDRANTEPENFDKVYADLDKLITPGMVHWQSPKFHGFFPIGFSESSVYADILSTGFSSLGFTWDASPVYTELEVVMMDWLAKEMELPSKFIFESKLGGGGVIQGSASEAMIVSLMAARERMIAKLTFGKTTNSPLYYEYLAKLRAYCSDQTHSSLEKGCRICAVHVREVSTEPTDLHMSGIALSKAIEEDKAAGYIPFFVCSTLGTTNTCAFDNLNEIGQVCKANDIWLHVDAAYAGSLFFFKQYRPLLNGIEYAQSLNFNPYKLMNISFDCAVLWVENANALTSALGLHAPYLKNESENVAINYKDWQISLGCRFRALKVWLHIRLLGMNHVRREIQKKIDLSFYMQKLIEDDGRLEIPYPIAAGTLCFRMKNDPTGKITKKFFSIANSKDIFLSSSKVKDRFIIRFPIGSSKVEAKDIDYCWGILVDAMNFVNSDITTNGTALENNAAHSKTQIIVNGVNGHSSNRFSHKKISL